MISRRSFSGSNCAGLPAAEGDQGDLDRAVGHACTFVGVARGMGAVRINSIEFVVLDPDGNHYPPRW